MYTQCFFPLATRLDLKVRFVDQVTQHTVVLPEWATYIAADEDGCLFAYESRPLKLDGQWLNDEHKRDRYCRVGILSKPYGSTNRVVNWETLYEYASTSEMTFILE